MRIYNQALISASLLSVCGLLGADPGSGDMKAPTDAVSAADQRSPLPSPLTLDYVLSLGTDSHPNVLHALAEIEHSQARTLGAQSATGLQSTLQGALRYVEPPGGVEAEEDHYVQWSLQKRLYDFGHSSHAEDAAQQNEQGSQWDLVATRNRHRIEIMRHFFDVLLADLSFIRDNEAMSVAFVSLDRLRKRQELGQKSDIEILEAETIYQNSRRKFYSSRSLQRSSRNRLANSINRPGELAAEVAEPKLTGLFDKLPDIEVLQQQALAHNPVLKAMRYKLQAAQDSMESARAFGRPFIDTEARMAEYTRAFGNRNRWEVELRLNVPLWTGGRSDAALAQARGTLMKQQALYNQVQMDVGQKILETWQLLDELRVLRDHMQKESEFRELYLDRSRALYELEWKTDLGDSMVQVSDARYRLAKVTYDTAIAWARLDALLGKDVFPVKEKPSETK
ncbi:MAG: TolC family protein [Gammaproteobacteria bacterium]|nr:TolC family protein [Gammaproteobacteria bacterium]MDH5801117.1 TolC family protein [Gammaproteobacteria bacterium]